MALAVGGRIGAPFVLTTSQEVGHPSCTCHVFRNGRKLKKGSTDGIAAGIRLFFRLSSLVKLQRLLKPYTRRTRIVGGFNAIGDFSGIDVRACSICVMKEELDAAVGSSHHRNVPYGSACARRNPVVVFCHFSLDLPMRKRTIGSAQYRRRMRRCDRGRGM